MKIKFNGGGEINTNLSFDETFKRLNRLDTLIVLTEGYDEGVGVSIYQKAVRAYNKVDNFNGIIRLTRNEKEFLSYCLEREFISKEEKSVIMFYCGR